MTNGLLRAAWVAGAHRAVRSYADTVRDLAGPGATEAFVLAPKTATMESITGRLEHMDVDRYDTVPTHLVLSEVATLDEGLTLEAALATGAESLPSVVVSGLYREVVTVEGKLGPPASGFGAAIQFGTFAMRSAADEWAVSEWYRTRRLPSFRRMEGGHRARRYVSVCGGPAKLGVLYEFRSLADRAAHFEPLETVDHDEDQPTAAARTVHPPMSPSVGELLPREG